jgi:general secretion pathway protein G
MKLYTMPRLGIGKLRSLNQAGMTLLEIMIVLVIVGGLMAVLAPKVTANLQKSKIRETRLRMGELGKALDMFYTDCGAYPTAEQGLNALLQQPSGCNNWGPDPYVNKGLLKDSWGKEFMYEQTGSSYVLRSLGRDGRDGGKGADGDISSEEETQESAE